MTKRVIEYYPESTNIGSSDYLKGDEIVYNLPSDIILCDINFKLDKVLPYLFGLTSCPLGCNVSTYQPKMELFRVRVYANDWEIGTDTLNMFHYFKTIVEPNGYVWHIWVENKFYPVKVCMD